MGVAGRVVHDRPGGAREIRRAGLREAAGAVGLRHRYVVRRIQLLASSDKAGVVFEWAGERSAKRAPPEMIQTAYFG
jgi:hypothetical protein